MAPALGKVVIPSALYNAEKANSLYCMQQLQSASPRFADSELDAVLEQLEDDNHIMFRDWVIHRI